MGLARETDRPDKAQHDRLISGHSVKEKAGSHGWLAVRNKPFESGLRY